MSGIFVSIYLIRTLFVFIFALATQIKRIKIRFKPTFSYKQYKNFLPAVWSFIYILISFDIITIVNVSSEKKQLYFHAYTLSSKIFIER